MLDWLLHAILNESRWLGVAMAVAGVGVAQSLWRARGCRCDRGRVLSAMHLFYGSMIGVMGLGHLLAVSVVLALGQDLRTPAFVLYTRNWHGFATPVGACSSSSMTHTR